MRFHVATIALMLVLANRAIAEEIKVEKLEIKNAFVEIPKSPDGETAVVIVRLEIKNFSKKAVKVASNGFHYKLQKQGPKPETHPHFGLRHPDKVVAIEIKPEKVEFLEIELAAKKVACDRSAEYKLEIEDSGERKVIVVRFK